MLAVGTAASCSRLACLALAGGDMLAGLLSAASVETGGGGEAERPEGETGRGHRTSRVHG